MINPQIESFTKALQEKWQQLGTIETERLLSSIANMLDDGTLILSNNQKTAIRTSLSELTDAYVNGDPVDQQQLNDLVSNVSQLAKAQGADRTGEMHIVVDYLDQRDEKQAQVMVRNLIMSEMLRNNKIARVKELREGDTLTSEEINNFDNAAATTEAVNAAIDYINLHFGINLKEANAAASTPDQLSALTAQVESQVESSDENKAALDSILANLNSQLTLLKKSDVKSIAEKTRSRSNEELVNDNTKALTDLLSGINLHGSISQLGGDRFEQGSDLMDFMMMKALGSKPVKAVTKQSAGLLARAGGFLTRAAGVAATGVAGASAGTIAAGASAITGLGLGGIGIYKYLTGGRSTATDEQLAGVKPFPASNSAPVGDIKSRMTADGSMIKDKTGGYKLRDDKVLAGLNNRQRAAINIQADMKLPPKKIETKQDVIQTIITEARKYEPAFPGITSVALALANKESSLNPKAIGPTIDSGMHKGDHAIGPFQYMAATADAEHFDRTDPLQNIQAGVRDLASHYRAFNSWPAAVAAHHAGAGAVRRSIIETGQPIPSTSDGLSTTKSYTDSIMSVASGIDNVMAGRVASDVGAAGASLTQAQTKQSGAAAATPPQMAPQSVTYSTVNNYPVASLYDRTTAKAND